MKNKDTLWLLNKSLEKLLRITSLEELDTLTKQESRKLTEVHRQLFLTAAELARDKLTIREAMSFASHELRNPLTTIHGYIYMLSKTLDDESTREARWVRELTKETNRLTKRVKKLLTPQK